MNNKYIIDGVEYKYGEEVEVSDAEAFEYGEVVPDEKTWLKRFFVSHLPISRFPVGVTLGKPSIHEDEDCRVDVYWYKHIRKIQPTPPQTNKEIKKIDTSKIRGKYQEIQYTEQGNHIISGGDDTISSIKNVAYKMNEVIDLLNTNNLSGRKATLILDGTEHTVTFE